MEPLLKLVQQAGVVGAGGAGFPTYVKLDCQVDLVLANGAECEPLLYKDQVLMQQWGHELCGGMLLAMKQVGASRGVIGIKKKNADTIAILEPLLPENIEFLLMDDVYPAGDEVELVFHATGQRIPAGGLPKDIGVLVNNIESFINVFRAANGHPVTDTMITVHGEVVAPYSAWLPLGMTYREAVELAGGMTAQDCIVVEGGPMMGAVTADFDKPITKVSSGLLVLPRTSRIARIKLRSEADLRRIGKAACDQCSLCTSMCPRNLLGYPIKPHLAMRSLQVSGSNNLSYSLAAQACSECNLCTMWSCPEGLDPSRVCATTKRVLREHQQWQSPDELQAQTTEVHPLREYRGVPTKRLARRLELTDYMAKKATFHDFEITPEKVAIPLAQHIGQPALAIVTKGETVTKGQMIGQPAEGGLSTAVHASISGIVTAVGDSVVIQHQAIAESAASCN
ncbi:4Fe-4S dicluster domain-containing protein [Photobacterium rosenbergii]|uniref:4Fe-4S dicluster domain-containing protein n=1 Tax=Photobacterium rosenbergii TaxID=294936 RepID=A0ABU3ZG11_9GAMM|nr:4Fe-4S dicluster domain-containing protein [Photobacterium rosenbergii]MDV5169049.1 4Fe-4S dicluster domain-containing protein [Photobacterium rosenbergii]